MAETIQYLSARGVPVLAHIGLMPQYVNTMGGYLSQGKTPEDAARILADAHAVERAGAFGIVLEGVQEALAADITAQVSIPTIGIGASPACDGQILVTEDILGLSGERVPKFVKRYADLDTMMRKAVEQYADEVRSGAFPEPQHCFGVKNT
jgi:3-methyl-2-oxobutanoate hydroxymethyltransferase